MSMESKVAELALLRKKAQELAHDRKERATTVHLLTVLAAESSQASHLLRERRCDPEVLVKGARTFSEDNPHAISEILDSARDFARRTSGREPGGIHVLLA